MGGKCYEYDNRRKLITDTAYNYWSDEVFEYTTFAYDNNDNVIQSEVFNKNISGEFKSDGKVSAVYDSKNNPYNNDIGLATYFIRNEIFLISRHNITSFIIMTEQCEIMFMTMKTTDFLSES